VLRLGAGESRSARPAWRPRCSALFGFGFGESGVLETVALAGDGDDGGVMEEAVEDGAGGGDVRQGPPLESAAAIRNTSSTVTPWRRAKSSHRVFYLRAPAGADPSFCEFVHCAKFGQSLSLNQGSALTPCRIEHKSGGPVLLPQGNFP